MIDRDAALLCSTAPAPCSTAPAPRPEPQPRAKTRSPGVKNRRRPDDDTEPKRPRGKQKLPRGPPTPIEEYLCFSVKKFCELNSISTAFYYLMRQRGIGPKEMRVGEKVLISRESAEQWRRDREAGNRELLAKEVARAQAREAAE
jgi:hypothetical protein